MTDHEALQILPTPKKRASYRPAALRSKPPTTQTQTETLSSPPLQDLSRTPTATSLSGEVTKQHWKPDSSSSTCTACHSTFTVFDRKHHCRRCGGIFCALHSRYTVPLSCTAEFSVIGNEARSCGRCRREYELWVNPPDNAGTATSSHDTTSTLRKKEEEGGSVPTDWAWSTF